MYNFKRLINLYKTDKLYKLTQKQYYNEFGELIKDTTEKEHMFGAVTPIKPEEVQFLDGGVSQHNIKKVYCYEDFKLGEKLLYDEEEYTIINKLDYHEHDKGLVIYYMERGETSKWKG